mmetsp:Transcript_15055/g.19025  ORF Transcript_15055/g.19025 Transcript_15055/m.19025 type:complete len:254 (-) Transcript_15055:1192-1953(-)
MRLLLKVDKVGYEADRVDDALVIEEHTGDLAGGLAVALLDNLVDVVTDLLAALSGIKLLETLDVGSAHELLLLLGHHLLLHDLGLVGGHLRLGRGDLSGGGGGLGLLLLSLVALAAAALAHVVAVAATVVELAALATVLTLVALALVSAMGAATVLALATHLLHATGAELAALVGVDGAHEVLLHLLEAALLALLVKLLGGHPELDGEGTGAEGSRLVEELDGTLSAVDVLEQDEVLAVCRLRVEIFTLTKFN